ncbi:MAG TPA: glycosyltransferase family 2 protein [Halomicronema sp.]
MSPRVSVIVLNWNGKAFLGECLESLAKQTYQNFETVVVDNGSTDDSQDYVRSHFPNVRLIELPENLGFCGGNNQGYKYVESEYIALLNNDTICVPEWLESLCNALENYPEAGFAASKLVYYDKPEIIDSAGDTFSTYGIGRKRGHQCQDGDQYNQEKFIFGACGGAVLYRKTMLEEIGFLDDDFFLIYEDIDLSFRAQLAGWKCVYVPQAKVLHRVSASLSKTPNKQIYFSKRNSLWVLIKNMPTPLLLKFSIFILAYHLASDLKWMAKGYTSSIFQGHLDVLRTWQQVMKKRKTIQSMRKVSISELEKIITTT